MRRRLLLLLVCVGLSRPVLAEAAPVELVMVMTAGCPWCARWDRELGPIYPRTPEGRRAPLRRVELRGFNEPLALAEPLLYTPTFVLVEHGREIGRIVGYQGQDAFWGLLGQLIARLDRPAGSNP